MELDNNTIEALTWWRKLSVDHQRLIYEREFTMWTFELFSASVSSIRKAWLSDQQEGKY